MDILTVNTKNTFERLDDQASSYWSMILILSFLIKFKIIGELWVCIFGDLLNPQKETNTFGRKEDCYSDCSETCKAVKN